MDQRQYGTMSVTKLAELAEQGDLEALNMLQAKDPGLAMVLRRQPVDDWKARQYEVDHG